MSVDNIEGTPERGFPKYDEDGQVIINFDEWFKTDLGKQMWIEHLIEQELKEMEQHLQEQYKSYGDRNLITFQSKVNRGLYDVFDVCRRIQNKTRKETLEDYMRWMITEHQKDHKELNNYLEKGKERCSFIEN